MTRPGWAPGGWGWAVAPRLGAGLALVATLVGPSTAAAQDPRDNVGLLRCGTVSGASVSPELGDLVTVTAGTSTPILGTLTVVPCGGPAVASFTAEASSPVPAAAALLAVVAQCVGAVPPVPGQAGCTVGSSVIFQPSAFRFSMALQGGPEARSISVVGLLTPGQWDVQGLVAAIGGDIVVGPASLNVIAAGRPGGSAGRAP